MAENAGSPARRAAPVVLVIEDDPDIGALLSDLLRGAGYAVRVVDTALGVRGEIERLHPVAIVLDLGLPYCSGAALLADLKADPVTAPIPVLVVSAYLECLSADRAALATTVLAKPFAPLDLLAAVRAAPAIQRHVARVAAERQLDAPAQVVREARAWRRGTEECDQAPKQDE